MVMGAIEIDSVMKYPGLPIGNIFPAGKKWIHCLLLHFYHLLSVFYHCVLYTVRVWYARHGSIRLCCTVIRLCAFPFSLLTDVLFCYKDK